MKLHRNVTPRQEVQAEKKLFAAVAALRSPEECKAFFKDLCTPAEIQAMADRWAVVEFLQKGLPYREIHRLTGVSVTTIGRVARFVVTGNGGYQLASQRIEGHSKPNGEDSRRPEGPRNG
jgi:TrpR-related protein YerC/YecD